MSNISIHELESAINYWRARSPATGDELRLGKEASALSKPYALLIVTHQHAMLEDELDAVARNAWQAYIQLKNL
ncbi:DUF3717 domain-containing protein [Candidatus Vallotia cooleyia]|uniref:DUF3717 domain-containing protein n=1 Tax=Candidatus Vallotiella adelgis TaxID=1177211 RepID=UPI001D013CFD|nr:DUF3717 domain-containing protein [Candidatus Vallotia cooleyia]UDG81807.1 hypothetical protein GJV44_00005 [Candidatus Vallotia cooleyia]